MIKEDQAALKNMPEGRRKLERVTVYGIHHVSFLVVDLGKFVSKFKFLTSIEPIRQADGAMLFEFPNGTAFQVRQAEGHSLGGLAKDRKYRKPQEFKTALIVDDLELLKRALRGLGLPYSIRHQGGKHTVDFTVCNILFHSVLIEEMEGYFDV